ncbi:TraX family protein [Sulfuriferula sp.]|uniref:TraX family protein n=1 Tax=Sulfuriferula sp. TaxID=2025307 RepID=UPI0027307778|nr:TraX family protein [Sulfuriferula sp.]MDP2027881.1 TraX family protein [Sulfuriferula sp.]
MNTATAIQGTKNAQAQRVAFFVPNGTIESLKWLALALMTLDHVNKYLLGDKLAGAFALGRLAMPIFAFVLAYNLARPGAMENGAHLRTMKRLLLVGVIASPFFMGLGGLAEGWWPLNILFLLALATASMYLIEKGTVANWFAAWAVFLIGGAFVEFWWFGLGFCLAAWWYCKTRSRAALLVWVFAAASLYAVNRNLWALVSIPLILAAPLVEIGMPRLRNVFYMYYPAHLAVLLLISTVLGIRV